MINRIHLLGAAAFAAALASPARASVIVIGNSNARICYEAADSTALPGIAALRTCDEALRYDALSDYEVVATHVNRGILRYRRGMTDAAVADFDRAITLDPNQPEAYLNKGAALIRGDNSREALTLLTMALERNTSRPALAHYARAIANETLGNLNAAYRDYREASRIDPDWNEPRVELARFRVVGP